MSKEKLKTYAQGMYGELPKVVIGDFAICEFTDPPGDSVWIEEADGGEGMQASKENLSKALLEFYKKNF